MCHIRPPIVTSVPTIQCHIKMYKLLCPTAPHQPSKMTAIYLYSRVSTRNMYRIHVREFLLVTSQDELTALVQYQW